MTSSADTNLPVGFRWRCQRTVVGVRYNQSASIKQGLWFQQSNLTLQEILLIRYDNMCCGAANQIQNEYCLSTPTVADWSMFCTDTMLMILEGCSVKIGAPNKTVEIDESKFGRQRYHRRHPVKCKRVLGRID